MWTRLYDNVLDGTAVARGAQPITQHPAAIGLTTARHKGEWIGLSASSAAPTTNPGKDARPQSVDQIAWNGSFMGRIVEAREDPATPPTSGT